MWELLTNWGIYFARERRGRQRYSSRGDENALGSKSQLLELIEIRISCGNISSLGVLTPVTIGYNPEVALNLLYGSN